MTRTPNLTSMLAPGSRFLDYLIGQKIGQGSFGEIYSAIDQKNGILWAIKTESADSTRKTLQFEYQILAQIQSSPHFPRLGIYGHGSNFIFYSMELLGPSLSHILRHIPSQRFSLSTSVRSAFHILRAVEAFHVFGFVHRDLKPGNILTREGSDYPLCLIDFGLSHVYMNPQTGKHNPPRSRVGFRGTKMYASVYAHRSKDLSRRDDLISWFYITVELLTGWLPWRGLSDKAEIASLKESYDVERTIGAEFPELVEVWRIISALGFTERPDYQQIYAHLRGMMERLSISLDDPFDWAPHLHSHRQRIAQLLENTTIRREIPLVQRVPYYTEHLLGPNVTAKPPFSHVSDSEDCCC